MLIIFDDMIADMFSNKKLNLIVTELFIRRTKLNISLFFLLPKNIRLNSTYYFIMKILKSRELQQISFENSSGIDL